MLRNALLQQYPDLQFGPNESGVECAIFRENGVDSIVQWNRPEPKPDEAELLANFDAGLYANRQTWEAQARARKDREARKALALPDSDDPAILKQKLNAALALLNVR